MKKTHLLLIITVISIFSSCNNPSNEVRLVPQPENLVLAKGIFAISDEIKIIADSSVLTEATYFAGQLKAVTGHNISVGSPSTNGKVIYLTLSNTIKGKESYTLNIGKKQVKISAKEPAGIFYGIQTLLQLANQYQEIPCMAISDSPKFSWRGLHFDVSRHLFAIDEIKRIIDLAAIHKLNVFHWHLVDDQGWRIEIKKYPELTSKGAWRKGNATDPWSYFAEPVEEDQPKYGGFYSQEEIKEIVRYARERHITIVPEIEMPGHSWAALMSYPELTCSGKVWKKPDDVAFEFSDPFCAGNENSFIFLQDVLDEIMTLFPSHYIHIGGDEAKKTTWANCPKCKKRLKDEKLQFVEELQSYFIRRVGKYIESKGREIIGWDEILEGGLAEGATVMSWRGEEGGIAAAKQKHHVIMANSKMLYFDYAQDPDTISEKYQSGKISSLLDVYHYNPVPKSLTGEEKSFVIGVEACLWTEYVYRPEQIYDRLLPRLAALSEISWGSTEKNDNTFLAGMKPYFHFLDKLGYNYHAVIPVSASHEMSEEGTP